MSNSFVKSEAWSSVLQSQLRQAFVGKFVTDMKFEGKFDGNDTVHFKRTAKVQFSSMASSYVEVPVSALTDTDETFTLNERQGFSVAVSDEDYKELNIDPNSQVMRDAVEQSAKLYDTNIMGQYANAGITVDDGNMTTATNGGAGNAIVLTKSNIYDFLTGISEAMDAAVDSLGNATGIPDSDRWVILSPAEKRLLANAPELLRSTDLGDKTVTGGFMGTVDNLKIYWSNNLTTASSVKHVLAGQGKPICFAANIKPKVQFVGSETQANTFVNYLKCQTKFDSKVFAEGAERLIDCEIDAS